ASGDPPPAAAPVGEGAARYRSAFLSYASEDRDAVIRGAQMLRSVGIAFFQDVVDLDPGERWEQRLYAEIGRNDLFLLFWSRAAKGSDWVRREALYALDCRSEDQDRPQIKPIILERPPSDPWPELAHLHFADPLAYFVEGGGS
ncbi:MAG: toll/interleukin-1 receptor domain-containing protein, partial [Solirubrobacterales bacterium]|nr:toll/interleukin-1 receptor domain-containing protein [Solirubrobacterales bacterium]